MELALQLIGSFGIFLLLLAAGMAVPFAIAVPGVLYLLMQNGLTALKGIGLVTWGSMNSFTLTAIPLFVLMAELMQRSGLSFRIYRGLAKVVSRLPGGLLQTNIVGCALFASISGSSVATAASIGGVALPQLVQRNYDRRLSAGIAGRGRNAGHSAAAVDRDDHLRLVHRDLGGQAVHGRRHPRRDADADVHGLYRRRARSGAARCRAVRRTDGISWLTALADIVPFALLIGGIMGSIYAGWATPTEAASGGCLFALILCLIWGELTWEHFVEAHAPDRADLRQPAVHHLCRLHLCLCDRRGGRRRKRHRLAGRPAICRTSSSSRALFVLYTVLGCLVESIGMIVITVPLLYPVLGNYGIDPIWFGVILVMYVELGQISPPIGINLFVIQSIWDGELSDVVMGTIPFHIIMFVLLFLLTAFPQLALWLPSQMN